MFGEIKKKKNVFIGGRGGAVLTFGISYLLFSAIFVNHSNTSAFLTVNGM